MREDAACAAGAEEGALDEPAPLRLRVRPGPPLGAIFGAIGALAGVAVGVLHLDRLPFALCTFKVLTGQPCPTCGSTRALGRLFALDPAGAFAMNPLATLGAFVLLVWALVDLALLPGGRALQLSVQPRLARWLRGLAVLAFLLNWVYLLASHR